jgi:DNA-binding transcriptional regulator YbjK
MLKNQVGRPRGDAREKLLAAAFECVRDRGYAAASSRAIGHQAAVNPALVFYYFDSVDDLIVESLALSNEARLDAYRAGVESARGLADLVRLLGELYRADIESGHIRVVSELVGASVSRPDLAPKVTALMEPWLRLAEAAIGQALDGHPLADIAPVEDLALAAVTFYLGANLMTDLLSSLSDFERLVELAGSIATTVDVLAPARERRP